MALELEYPKSGLFLGLDGGFWPQAIVFTVVAELLEFRSAVGNLTTPRSVIRVRT